MVKELHSLNIYLLSIYEPDIPSSGVTVFNKINEVPALKELIF